MTTIARRSAFFRAILLGAAVATMATGLAGGLARMGIDLPVATQWADSHGPMMISGLFGTLISLERAVAHRRAWAYAAPLSFAVGGLTLASGLAPSLPGPLFAIGSAIFVAVSIAIFLLQRALFTGLLVLGAACLLAGNSLLATGADVSSFAGLWVAFLVCTIAAERLELSRVLAPSRSAAVVFAALLCAFVIGAGIGLLEQPGRTIGGIGLLGAVAWLARHDVAMRTARMKGQPRFMAMAMLLGYAWLAATAVFLLVPARSAFDYDLVLHAVFIGFVMSMVFGHALIIMPALTGVRLAYSTWLHLPLGLLHLAVLLRVAGDIGEAVPLRIASGGTTLLALLGFVSTLLLASRASRSR
jgi:hypothetical protein